MNKFKLNRVKNLYVFSCEEHNIIKIGVSSNPLDRLDRVLSTYKGFNFKLEVTREFDNFKDCLNYEKYLHNKFKDHRVDIVKYDGYTEIFCYDILQEVLLDVLSETKKLRKIDPYLVLKEGVLNLVICEENGMEYMRIFADLFIAKTNGFSGILLTSYLLKLIKNSPKYEYCFKHISKGSNYIMVSDYEDVLSNLKVEDVQVSYRDSMLTYINGVDSYKTSLDSIFNTVSVMEHYIRTRPRRQEFYKLMRNRGVNKREVDIFIKWYKDYNDYKDNKHIRVF